MATVSDIVTEINHVQALIANRSKAIASASTDMSTIEMKFVTQVANKIGNLAALDTIGSNALFQAVNDASLADDSRNMLVDAIDNKLLNGEVDDASGNATQKCVHPTLWMKADFLEGIQDQRKSFAVKLQMLADYLTSMGINHPHEQTYKWWFAALIGIHYTEGFPSYQSIYKHLEDLKANVAASRKKWPFPPIATYPKSPHQLPDAQYTYIFGDDLIAPVEIPRLAIIANHNMPLRKNSKLLEMDGKPKPSFLQQPDSASHIDGGSTSAGHVPLPQASSNGPDTMLCHVKTSATANESLARPHWATELISMLSSPDARHTASPMVQVKKEQAIAGLQSISTNRRPVWVDELLAALGSHTQEMEECVMTAPKAETDPQKRIAQKLRPKSSIGLRLDTPHAPEPIMDADEQESGRVSMEDYERRSMDAMESIHEKRQAAKAEKALLNKKQKADKAKAGKPSSKSEASAANTEIVKSDAKPLMKKPSAHTTLKRPASSADTRRPKCPAPDDSTPVHYNGGVIYNPLSKPAFRCIRTAGNYNSEKQCFWKGDMESAWNTALEHIDEMRLAHA